MSNILDEVVPEIQHIPFASSYFVIEGVTIPDALSILRRTDMFSGTSSETGIYSSKCRDRVLSYMEHSTSKRIWFSFYNFNNRSYKEVVESIAKWFDLIESRMNLSDRTTFNMVEGCIGQRAKSLIRVNLSSVWLKNNISRSLLTLMLRHGVTYNLYSANNTIEDSLDAVLSKRAILYFLDGHQYFVSTGLLSPNGSIGWVTLCNNNDPTQYLISEYEIRKNAYFKWVEAGRPEDDSLRIGFWKSACESLHVSK